MKKKLTQNYLRKCSSSSYVKDTSFLFTDKLEAKETTPIKSLLKTLGLPPNPPFEASGNFSWEDVAGRGRRMLGLNVLLSVQVAEDVRNTSRNRVVVGLICLFL